MEPTKFTGTMNSKNFFVSLLSIVLLALEANELSINVDAETVIDTIGSGDVGRIVSVVLINLLNPITKLLTKTASWTWDFLKSFNFWTQVVTTVLTGIMLTGVVFPDGAGAEIVTKIFGGQFEGIAVAIVINVLNPLYHFIFDRKKKESVEVAKL